MTDKQSRRFWEMISLLDAFAEFHHGDCIGADDDAADIVAEILGDSDMDMRTCKIVCHPPVDEQHRAFNEMADETREPLTHFARNRAIVDETDVLCATPWQTETPAPKTGGGTWYTIEYAMKKGKPVHIIWPDGSVSGNWHAAKAPAEHV